MIPIRFLYNTFSSHIRNHINEYILQHLLFGHKKNEIVFLLHEIGSWEISYNDLPYHFTLGIFFFVEMKLNNQNLLCVFFAFVLLCCDFVYLHFIYKKWLQSTKDYFNKGLCVTSDNIIFLGSCDFFFYFYLKF